MSVAASAQLSGWISQLPVTHELHTEQGFDKDYIITPEQQVYSTPALIETYNYRFDDETVGRRWFVHTQGISEILLNPQAPRSFYLPIENQTAYAENIVRTVDSSTQYETILGDIVYHNFFIPGPGEPCLGRVGQFGIAEGPSGLYGYILTEDHEYSIAPFGPSISVIYEALVPEEYLNNECSACSGFSGAEDVIEPHRISHVLPESGLGSTDLIENHQRKEMNDSDGFQICIVRVAVVFTLSGARETGDQIASANLMIAQMNTALRNSEVFNLEYRLGRVAVLNNFDLPPLTDPFDALNLVRPIDQPGEVLGDIRQQDGADQILVVVGADRLIDAFGVSELLSAPNERDFGIVRANTEFRFTPAHELAHNHGCKHDNDNAVGGPGQLTSFARGFRLSPNRGTIMFLPTQNDRRIIFFSNPSVEFDGNVIGTLVNDNARQLRETACFVSGLHGQNDSRRAGITLRGGVDEGAPCPDKMSTWRVNGNECDIISVQWSYSFNGGPFLGFGGNTAIASLFLQFDPGVLTIRAIVECNPGSFLTATSELVLSECFDPCGYQGPNPYLVSDHQDWIQIYSLTHDGVVLKNKKAIDQYAVPKHVEVCDMLGRPQSVTSTIDGTTLNIYGLNKGQWYFVSFESNGQIITKAIYQ